MLESRDIVREFLSGRDLMGETRVLEQESSALDWGREYSQVSVKNGCEPGTPLELRTPRATWAQTPRLAAARPGSVLLIHAHEPRTRGSFAPPDSEAGALRGSDLSRGPRDQFLELQPARKSRISSPGRNGIVTGAEAASAILRLTCSKSGLDQPTLVTSISPSRAIQKVVGTLLRP